MRLFAIAFGAILLLSGCSTPAQMAEPIATESPASQPIEEPQENPAPEPEVSIEDLQALIQEVPNPDIESLRQHFLIIDEGVQGLDPFPIEYQLGPTAIPEKVEAVIDRFSKKLKMFQLVGLESLDQDWVIASENDYEWWVDYRSNQDPDYPLDLWDADLKELGHCRLSSDVFCGAGNYVNGKNYQDNVVGTRFTDRGLDYVARHEGAHFYQAVFGYGGRCWFAEGQATFFETYLETSSRSRSQVIQDLLRSEANLSALSEQELIDLISSDGVCYPDYRVAYDLGMLAFEYLYMNFSFAQVHDLMVRSSEAPWDQSLVEVLELDPNEFNGSLAGYIYSQMSS